MSATTAAVRGRTAAESLMVDSCTISRAGAGEPVYNPVTDTYTYPAAASVYSGKCRVKPANVADTDDEAGETVVGVRRFVVSLPMSVTAVRRDDVVTVTTSALDPGLAGTRFRVLGAVKGSQVTARRLACEETGWVALPTGFRLLTETSDTLVTESGDALVQEAA